MRRNRVRLFHLLLGVLVVLAGSAEQNPAAAAISKISVLPTRVNVRIILGTAAPLQNIKSVYAKGSPATLVIEMGKVQAPEPPPVPRDDFPLLKDIKLQKTADSAVSLVLSLTEPVPYRIDAGPKATIIELDKILRSSEYLIGPDVREELSRVSRKSAPVEGIKIKDMSDRIEVAVPWHEKSPTNVFALENPLRLVADMIDTDYEGPTAVYPIKKLGLESIRLGQFKNPPPYAITRLVFDLQEARRYALTSGPQSLVISFSQEPSPQMPAAPTAEVLPKKPAEEKQKTVAPAPAPQPKPAAAIPAEAKLAPVKEAPPVALAKEQAAVNPPPIKTSQEQAVATKEEEKKQAQAQEEKPRIKVIQGGPQKYTGELLSPKFKDADLRDVILWLGERVGLNVTFDPDVKGTVTCSFVDIPWDQFLDLILKVNKQGKVLEGNVLRIAPLTVLASEEKAISDLRNARELAEPIQTKTFPLSYAKSKEVLELIKNKKSARGEIVTDDRTNTIIISDTKDRLDLMESLITELDTPTPQVQIETRIIEATSTFVQNFGIQWGGRAVADPFYGNQTSLQFPNKILVDGAMIPQGVTTRGIGGPLGGYAINLPAPAFNTVLGFSFANVLDTFRLDLALSALETSGQGRIISSQRLTAQNNKEAYINQGRQIPVQTQANFTVTTTFVNAGLELRATPQITAEGTIIMVLDIQNNAADFSNLVNGIPPITTQSAKTTVMVPDGGTTVIGGIYRIEDAISRERVPILYQIPILGNLFRSISQTKQNRELLIFITPRIMK
jgi:type IV pilus secretin PilQ/predicted competence protein